MTATPVFPTTERTRVRRLPKRATYETETIYAILDEALICHVGFIVDSSPVVIPTIHWRDGDTLYLHGSAASRMLRALRDGVDACVTVTLLDGLVLARSAFHHSMNYRSVVVFGKAREVLEDEKSRAMETLVEHVVRGRWKDVRQPNQTELRQTLVLKLSIEEASAKVRCGGPLDDEEDYALPIWAGVVPLTLTPGPPIPDVRVSAPVPEYATNYRR
jgi:nitroimidazol reductase NimA-like FMN-containing flavoprotein (pyridoxamine 5'-phosphate oxidase superfamily)